MNLWHLTAFREVMRTNSVTKAARNLGRTQPAVSNCISNLEQDVGYRLFERRNGRLHPVPEAQYLLTEAEEILSRMGALERTMKGIDGAIPYQVRLVCMPVLSEFFMPRLIAQFVYKHPHVRFLLISASSHVVYEQVAAQQFDIGLAEMVVDSDLVDVEPREVTCVCALPKGDPLESRSFVTPEDLDGRPCATFLDSHFITRQLKQLFDEAGCDLNIQFQVQNGASQYSLVASKVAYGVFSPLSAWIFKTTNAAADGISFVPLRPAIPYRYAILTPAHKTLSQTARSFARELRGSLDSILADEQAAATPRLNGAS